MKNMEESNNKTLTIHYVEYRKFKKNIIYLSRNQTKHLLHFLVLCFLPKEDMHGYLIMKNR